MTPLPCTAMKRVAVSGALLVALLAGCGGGSGAADTTAGGGEASAALGATLAYQSAFLDGDAAAACALLTGKAKRDLIAEVAVLAERPTCESSLEGVFGLAGPDDLAKIRHSHEELKPSDVNVQGHTATVHLPQSGNDLELERVDGHWYVADPTPAKG